MRLTHSTQIKGIAAGVVLTLLLQPIPQATAQQFPTDAQTSQLPDSPGAVQSRPTQLQAMMKQESSTPQAPASQPSNTEPAQAQTSDSGNDPVQGPATQNSSDQAPASAVGAEGAASPGDSQTSEQSQPQLPQNPHEPVGTAAAESVATTGVAASRPAGVAVAPAKQQRMRSILIKVGALVGVGVAVGKTVALSQGSPSRPPGSH